MQKLIDEGQKCIRKGKLEDAEYLFEQALLMNNWKSVYGGTVLSTLAYIKAKKGNYTLAQQYMDNHEKIYGDLGFDHDDIERFKFVSQAIDLNERSKEFN